ncbi:hypothetical protein DNH61_13995 [Paenibacillus sambharensis]|uniref:Uncharacterized protein n=1 Tax=Paenibacillus sambharensis TaxID=1803190 RepID=A0A2W1L635_9BACL|nr:hypothetical protein [Paenibacillus sambharensis]PZD95628.1 hypothetical protein DNH61_13995 [Paenibacillus sambharensis]
MKESDYRDRQDIELEQEQGSELEQELAGRLTDGPVEEDRDREARLKAKLSPKYEVRIQSVDDPIVEETKRFRSMAREIDDRYDRYMERAQRQDEQNGEGQ